ncbi:hypothetical protein DNK10_12245 [Pseudomonas daroniae]|nr:hypothetical protein DNK10_12245 [Pseudomonas daroniae]
MARFPAQPEGPGSFCRDAAFLAGSFGPPNFAARALPRGKTGSGAAVRETSTDPGIFLFITLSRSLLRSVLLNGWWLLP